MTNSSILNDEKCSRIRKRVTSIAFLTAFIVVGGFGVASAQQDENKVSQAAGATSGENELAEIKWPRDLQISQGTVTIYQPQLDELEEHKLTGRAAFSLKKNEEAEPIFGALWFSSAIELNSEERLAQISRVEITRVALSDATEPENQALAEAIEAKAQSGPMTMDLDRLVAALDASDMAISEADSLNVEPPKIIVEEEPAVLVFIDGEPKMLPIPDTKLLRVQNTPFPIILDPDSKAYYLNGGLIWYSAPDAKGPYQVTNDVPSAVRSVLQLTDEQKAELAGQVGVDGKKASQPDQIPKILVATSPTELIVIDGEPAFTPLVGADLLYVDNTETPLFFDPAGSVYYVLLSGRWYQTIQLLDGDWQYVSADALPDAFKQIPPDSDQASVLAQVAGTQEAEEAVVEASIPQVTAVNRKTAELTVSYNGEPVFEPIPGTSMAYAVNTETTVLEIGGSYYALDQGVWFISTAPVGPWLVANSIPEEVQEIPPQNPTYNAKYVKVYDSTPDYVYVGYTPGYLGSYIYNGTVIYGTGYYYTPWYGRYYYPRPLTWGFSVYYTSWSGWGFRVGWGSFHFRGGYIGGARWYGGGYYRNGWFGPGGYYNRRYDRYRASFNQNNFYINRNNIYDQRRNRDRNYFQDKYKNGNFDKRRDWANRRDLANRPGMLPAKDRANNIFTDKSGNIYRRNKDGSWDRRKDKGWEQTKLPGAGQRPTQRPGQRPALKPDQRPAVLPGGKDRPQAKPAQRPSQKPAAQRPANKKPAVAKRPAAKKPAQKRPATAKKPAQKRKPAAAKRPAPRKQVKRNNSNNLKRQHQARNRGNTRSRQNRKQVQRQAPKKRHQGGGQRRRR
ncbi:MAG: hypothetical protein ABJN26_28845 [Stappiaceae bacterium]